MAGRKKQVPMTMPTREASSSKDISTSICEIWCLVLCAWVRKVEFLCNTKLWETKYSNIDCRMNDRGRSRGEEEENSAINNEESGARNS